MSLPEDIILYIYRLKHNLHMLDVKKELFNGVMDHIIKTFMKYTSVIYYILVNLTNEEIDAYFKFLHNYYSTYNSYIDFYCYYYRQTKQKKIAKIIESIHIINNYFLDIDI